MDQKRFDAITRMVHRLPSRRVVLRGLAGAGLGLGAFRLSNAEAARNKPKKKGKKGKVTLCHQGQSITVSKSAVKRHRKHGDTVGPCPSGPTPSAPPPPGPVLTYQCPGPKSTTVFGGGTSRFAQTFTASQSGSLRQIQFSVDKKPATTGDYLVQLLRVVGGVPSDEPVDVLAQVTVPDAAVATSSDATLTATFAGPPLVAGTEYAVAFRRPGSNNTAPNTRTGDGSACDGTYFEANSVIRFTAVATHDILVSVLVA